MIRELREKVFPETVLSGSVEGRSGNDKVGSGLTTTAVLVEHRIFLLFNFIF